MLAAKPCAILFPGQGSSVEGSEQLVESYCAQMHARARELLGADPLPLAGESTRFAQPAIFLASLAGWRRASERGMQSTVFAGHSLGEITALAAAGVFVEQDALELVVLRAQLMENAGGTGDCGGMLAVLKGDVRSVERLASEFSVEIANYNAPGQIVLSGPVEALASAAVAARERGLRALQLGVSGAFHSRAMAPAREPFRRACQTLERRSPIAPVYSGLTAEPFRDEPNELADALCAPVRWTATMAAIDRGHGDSAAYVDVGPDCVIAGLVRRNLPHARVLEQEDLHAPA